MSLLEAAIVVSVSVISAAETFAHDVVDTKSVWEITRDTALFLAVCHGIYTGHRKHKSRKRRKRQ